MHDASRATNAMGGIPEAYILSLYANINTFKNYIINDYVIKFKPFEKKIKPM